jgi:hypothetical protein
MEEKLPEVELQIVTEDITPVVRKMPRGKWVTTLEAYRKNQSFRVVPEDYVLKEDEFWLEVEL